MDVEKLHAMNVEMPLRENEADLEYFNARLALSFSMYRADKSFTDRGGYLAALKKGGEPRESVSIDPITPVGNDRAVVTCVVRRGERQFHNLRVFVRSDTAPEGWLLLAWANEPV